MTKLLYRWESSTTPALIDDHRTIAALHSSFITFPKGDKTNKQPSLFDNPGATVWSKDNADHLSYSYRRARQYLPLQCALTRSAVIGLRKTIPTMPEGPELELH